MCTIADLPMPEIFGPKKYTADAPKAYLQSHGVIEMLEKLLNKFIDQRTELEKEEMNTMLLEMIQERCVKLDTKTFTGNLGNQQ